jgi:uncharacterized protein YaaW (UPF0174 family)
MLKVNYKGKEKVESESITFRIEKNILEELREDSEQKVKRINTLANRIFKSYVNWHRLANNAGLVYISKAFLVEVMGSLTDEQIVKLAKNYVKSQINYNTYVIQLDMGKKFALFFVKYLQFAFEDLKVKNVEFEVTDNMVMFRIKIS